MNGQQARHPAPLRILGSNEVTRSFRRYHEHVHGSWRHDLTEMNVESVTEGKLGPRPEVWRNVLPVNSRLGLIWRQDHDNIRDLDRIGDRHDLETAMFSFFPGGALPQSDDDIHPALLHIEGVGMALAAVTDYGHFLASNLLKICILIVINLHRPLLT